MIFDHAYFLAANTWIR